MYLFETEKLKPLKKKKKKEYSVEVTRDNVKCSKGVTRDGRGKGRLEAPLLNTLIIVNWWTCFTQ